MENDPNLFRRMLDSEKFIIVGKMASAIAHEINNPIMIISNLVSLILEDVGDNSLTIEPKSEHYNNLKEILTECQRISRITKTLFEFSRTSTGKLQTQDLETVIIDTLKLMEPLVVKAQVQLKMDIPTKSSKCNIRGNEIQQVLVHILDNALYSLKEKYPETPSSRDKKYIKITLRNEVISKGTTKMNYAVIDIYDDGIGLAPYVQQKIFTPFFTTKKAKQMESNKGQGLGLGLTFSKTIIEDHGGFIKFESREMDFARFQVFLPLIDETVKEDDDEVVF